MSSDPWVHEYLLAQARSFEPFVGSEIVVERYFQRDVKGELLRVAGATLIVAGFGVVQVAEVERVRAS